jgi:23S rRNA (guanine2445-N2)-methyltransferase
MRERAHAGHPVDAFAPGDFLHMRKANILITCPKGIPPQLKQELISLGFPVLSEHRAGVLTEGTLDDAQRLNLFIRTGHRVLFLLKEFAAPDAARLYRELSLIAWEERLPADGYLCVTSSVENPTINDTRYASLKCKDAIVDRIKKRRGRRPDSGPERDRSVVHLYWKGTACAVYLDTSGEPLSRRGYRKIPLAAPMQETLAAAVVLATGWEGSGTFVNPMCGSGTLAIEAALVGLNRAPGILRSNFGFMHLNGFDEALWKGLREKARTEARKTLPGRIIATDISPGAVEAAEKNAAAAGVAHLIEFGVCGFAETPLPRGGGVIALNPGYGERMGESAGLEGTYRGIGDFFKQKGAGYTGYVFTGNAALAKKVGLKPARTLQFYNSGIECGLLEYEVYEGSRKTRKPAAGVDLPDDGGSAGRGRGEERA